MNFSSDPASSTIFFIVYLWIIIWQGLSLWKSAQLKQKNWFVANLILNGITVGVLGITYLFFFAEKRMKLKDLIFWETK